MDAATRYLVQRMLSDVQFLQDQGGIDHEQATTMRSVLTPLVQQQQQQQPPPPQLQATKAITAPRSAQGVVNRGKVPLPPSSASSALRGTNASSPSHHHRPEHQLYPSSDHGDSSRPQDDEKVAGQWVRALWDFDASGGDDELRLVRGDEILLLDKSDEQWWKGEIPADHDQKGQPSRVGIFPANYVQLLLLPPARRAATAQPKQWSAPRARFSSTASPTAALPSPPAYGTTTTDAGGTSDRINHHRPPVGLQPVAPSAPPPAGQEEEQNAKRQGGQVKKLLNTPVGTAVASGVGFGVAASVVSSIL